MTHQWRAFFLLGGLVTLGACQRDQCTNHVVADSPSPGNELHAVVFQRVCKEKDPTTQISILPAGVTLANRDGNVMSAAGSADSVQLFWFGRNRLEIHYPATTHFLKRKSGEAAVVIGYVATSSESR